MIDFENAVERIVAEACPLESTQVELDEALGYVLAEPVKAPDDLPRFDNSAVDGFGIRISDLEFALESTVTLQLSDVVRAGDTEGEPLVCGQALKIFTGAPVPRGVEAVVMKEFCEEDYGLVRVSRSALRGDNIRRRGEEFRRGDKVLSDGVMITPPVVGLLAAFGLTSVAVHRKPIVEIVVTGSELVGQGQPLRPGQIYDSNSLALVTALQAMGIDDLTMSVSRDDIGSIRGWISRALRRADAVITVGGVSVGDCDLVREACASLEVEELFWKVAVKPGKPFFLGKFSTSKRSSRLVFGLPGNPVAAMLTLREFVRPGLLKMMGQKNLPPLLIPAVLEVPFSKKTERREIARGIASVKDDRLTVRPAVGQESHMLGGLAAANCLIHLPGPAQQYAENDSVNIEFLHWN